MFYQSFMRYLAAAGLSLAMLLFVAAPPSVQAEEIWETLPFPETYPAADSSGYSQVNGIKLFHAEWGKGDPVILLHGGLASVEAWAKQIPVMAKTHRVIAIDSRGHGRSTRDDKTYSYALMASDVVALMDKLAIAKAAFIGWSDGGIISLELAINHPDRISKAWVIGTNYHIDGIDHSVENNAVFGQYVGKTAQLYAKLSATPKGFDAFVGDISKMWATLPKYSEQQLQSINTPFTVVQALRDEAIIDEHAEKMASLLPGSTYVPVKDLSHFALWQDPGKMNALISAFLSK